MKKVILVLCMLICMTQIVTAEEGLSQTVSISGQHIIQNNEQLKSGRFTFILTAHDNAPMPEGSVNYVKEVTIDPGEKFEFGNIIYNTTGIYKYTVSRKIIKSKNLIQDDSVYNITVTVFDDSDPIMTIEKIGKEGKLDKIQYTDKYVPKVPPEITKTGDDTNLSLYIIVCLTSILALLVLMIKKLKKDI